ncbi:MAG: beta-ketoacyl synthase N-terminal-like domain-containing protein, partial [Phycisphaerales bacterium JB040]
LKYLPNMLACHVTIIHGLEGPSNTVTCAQSSALLSIGEGARVIERGDADVCVSGGAESKLNLLGLMRFDLAGRMAHAPSPETPAEETIRPFEEGSFGSVMGEGGGLVVLEHAERASARGARVYAELAGYGAGQSTSPYLPGVLPEPDADEPEGGQLRAIRAALDDAGLEPEDIDCVIPTASGVPALDRSELATLRAVFGEVPPVVTLTDRVGDCLAGHAGLGVCAAASILHDRAWPEGARRLDGAALPGTPPRAILITTHAIGGPAAACVLTAHDQPNT